MKETIENCHRMDPIMLICSDSMHMVATMFSSRIMSPQCELSNDADRDLHRAKPRVASVPVWSGRTPA